MKATGIVRRIDDLGRVVIPEEIRRTMRIREGELLHISLTDFGRFVGEYIVWWKDITRGEFHLSLYYLKFL